MSTSDNIKQPGLLDPFSISPSTLAALKYTFPCSPAFVYARPFLTSSLSLEKSYIAFKAQLRWSSSSFQIDWDI